MANEEDSTPVDNSSDQAKPDKDNLANLSSDPSHLFDQTNGIVEGLGGDDDEKPEDDDGTLVDPTLNDDATRQRPDEDGRLS